MTVTKSLKQPVVWLTVIILLGFILGPGSVDIEAVRTGKIEVGDSGKIIRAATVSIAGLLGIMVLVRVNRLKHIASEGNLFLMAYLFLAVLSSILSPVPLLTIYKSFEIFVCMIIVANIYSEKDRYEASKRYLYVLFSIYALTCIGDYVQLALIGERGQRHLVGATPFLNFVMMSHYPAMVGNALGFLGALVTLFGFHITCLKKGTKKRFTLGVLVILVGFGILVLSYTRSVLAFTFLSLFIYLLLRRQYKLILLGAFLLIALVSVPQIRDRIVDHLKRGATDEQIETMSGRTEMWKAVFDRSPVEVLIGNGFATGSRYMHFKKGAGGGLLKQKNVHNGFLEVVMSIGLIGAFIWLAIAFRLLLQFIAFYKKSRRFIRRENYDFHVFMLSVLILAYLRSTMNSTFVYLDYYFPLLMGFIMYGDSLAVKLRQLRSSGDSPSVKKAGRFFAVYGETKGVN